VYKIITATAKTSAASIAVLLLGILSTKIMAVIVGPSGIGLLSVLRQIQQTASTIGPASGETALVQGLASREGKTQSSYLVTTFWLFLFGSIAVAVALVGLAPWIAPLIFADEDTRFVGLTRWLAVPVVLVGALTYLRGVLNGFRAIGRLALVQLINGIVAAVLAYPVAVLVESGYASAYVFLMSAGFGVSAALAYYSAHRAGFLDPVFASIKTGISGINGEGARHFFSIAGATLLNGLAVMVTLLAIRALIVRYGGLAAAGIFDVAWVLSAYYLTLVSTSLTTYYLPTLSGEVMDEARATLVQQVLKLTTLITVPLVTTVVVLKPLVIQILYSDQFTPALEIMRWMLIGDYFRMAGWVLGMMLLAFANMRVFLGKQVILQVVLLACSYSSLTYFGELQGVGIGFLVMQVLNLVYLAYYVKRRYNVRFSGSTLVFWGLGLCLITGASLQTWSDFRVDWSVASLWIASTIIFCFFAIGKEDRIKLLTMLRRTDERA
jgi:O-antigen/teichoic acid export membrane protein